MPTKTTNTKSKLRGSALLKAAFNQIVLHPTTWDQTSWHCDTSHCIGGWCQILGGARENDATVQYDAAVFVGLSLRQANYLFNYKRTLPELRAFIRRFITAHKHRTFDAQGLDVYGYDSDGYNIDGYNRKGFNRRGYNREGYNRDGFDDVGYDRDGYNKDGYNYAGLPRKGYSKDGYDATGYNRKGYNKQGLSRDRTKTNVKPIP